MPLRMHSPDSLYPSKAKKLDFARLGFLQLGYRDSVLPVLYKTQIVPPANHVVLDSLGGLDVLFRAQLAIELALLF